MFDEDDEVTQVDPMMRNLVLQRDKFKEMAANLRIVADSVGMALSELMQNLVSLNFDVEPLRKTSWDAALRAHDQWVDSLSEEEM